MTATVTETRPTGPSNRGGLDGWFRIRERGTTPGRELRGGLATFFTMAYIIVLNPIILSGVPDKFGHKLDFAQVSAMTALVAAIMTIIMGLGGNLPLAIAAGAAHCKDGAFQNSPPVSSAGASRLTPSERRCPLPHL